MDNTEESFVILYHNNNNNNNNNNVACMSKVRKAYKVLVGKPESKIPLRRQA
jgi:hypothetical protein